MGCAKLVRRASSSTPPVRLPVPSVPSESHSLIPVRPFVSTVLAESTLLIKERAIARFVKVARPAAMLPHLARLAACVTTPPQERVLVQPVLAGKFLQRMECLNVTPVKQASTVWDEVRDAIVATTTCIVAMGPVPAVHARWANKPMPVMEQAHVLIALKEHIVDPSKCPGVAPVARASTLTAQATAHVHLALQASLN